MSILSRLRIALGVPRLKVINLGSGDVPGFDIDYPQGANRTKYLSASWLSQGYDGVVFRGEGPEATRLRPFKGDQCVLVDRHNGIVRFEDLTIHCGARQGVFFGLEHKGSPVLPNFKLEMRRVHIQADPPPSGQAHSTVWALFGYQADVYLEEVSIDARYSGEHASYWHGFAKKGLCWKRVRVIASGAEQCKVRNSPSETDWVKGARVVLQDCALGNWYQPWSWRGGAGVVLQGAGCGLVVKRCVFKGGGDLPGVPASSRSRCIMVDDSNGDYFSATDGKIGQGYATGHISIKECAFTAGPGTENLSIVIRVGRLGIVGYIARSLVIDGCAIYGERLQVQLSDLPAGKLSVRGCNTQAISARAAQLGIDTRVQAKIPLHDRVAEVSEGLER